MEMFCLRVCFQQDKKDIFDDRGPKGKEEGVDQKRVEEKI